MLFYVSKSEKTPQQTVPVPIQSTNPCPINQSICAAIPAGFTSFSGAGTGIASCSGANGFSGAFGAGSFFGVAGLGVGFLIVAGVLGLGVAIHHHRYKLAFRLFINFKHINYLMFNVHKLHMKCIDKS